LTASPTIDLPPTPLFAGLQQEDWPELLQHSSKLELGPMEPVFKQGDAADAFFVVLAGTVEIRSRGTSGPDRPLAHLSSGAVIGETSLLMGGDHSASAYAAEPLSLLRFPRDAFMTMIDQHSPGAIRVLYNMAHSLAVRLRAADTQIAELTARLPAAGKDQVVRNEVDRIRNIILTEWV
jgi:CRP-like cAMP-binding protein